MKDARGIEVNVGDEIAYAQRDGNSSVLRLYRVTAVAGGAVKAEPIDGRSSRVVSLPGVKTHGAVVFKGSLA